MPTQKKTKKPCPFQHWDNQLGAYCQPGDEEYSCQDGNNCLENLNTALKAQNERISQTVQDIADAKQKLKVQQNDLREIKKRYREVFGAVAR